MTAKSDGRSIFDLTGRVALITGGAGQLGAAMARGLARSGAEVYITSRAIDKAADAAATLQRESGGVVKPLALDVSNDSVLASAAKEFRIKHPHLHILVTCAGGNTPKATVTPDQSFFDVDLNAMREVMDSNFWGTLATIREFGPLMRESGIPGSIINIGSMAAWRPLTRVGAYSAAKAAVESFTQWLAVEFARKGVPIRVNAIAPGFFPAAQNSKLLFNADGSLTERGNQIVAHTPMGRFGTPEDLEGACLFLASHEASGFVTGTTIAVDGGFAVYPGV